MMLLNPDWVIACDSYYVDDYQEAMRVLAVSIAPKYGTNLREMQSDMRSQNISHARGEFYARAKSDLLLGASVAGRFMNKHHTTALEGVKQYNERLARSNRLARHIKVRSST